MSVLVRGMEMPTDCYQCVAAFGGCCYVAPPETDGKCPTFGIGKPDWCPLIPVPPHGRLIDADELEQDAQKRLLECEKHNKQFQKPYEVMRAIALAPTIIEAEEN